MNKLKEIWLWLKVTINPAYWVSNNSISKPWDRRLRTLIKEGAEVTNADDFTVDLGGITIWVSNYPYAYGNKRHVSSFLPTRRTRYLLRDYIEEKLSE